MIDYKALAQVKNNFKENEYPFLHELQTTVMEKKPYKDLKILHNVPLTLGTVIKIETLLLGGADVVVTHPSVVSYQKEALEHLIKANVELDLQRNSKVTYDLYLDCCGELANIGKPAIGAIELTQTGSYVYKNLQLNYPVISIDDSKLKYLESIGTGDGFVRAFRQLTNKNIAKKQFMIFGYGKVGKGIVNALEQAGAEVIVVEKNPRLIIEANQDGYFSIAISEGIKIKKHLKNTFAVVTATGVANCISELFEKDDFTAVKYLANMGALDEFGYKFSPEEILYSKKPINFACVEPTKMRFLDPIFFAHNNAIDLLLSKATQGSYQSFPEALALQIINKWSNLHNEDIDKITNFVGASL